MQYVIIVIIIIFTAIIYIILKQILDRQQVLFITTMTTTTIMVMSTTYIMMTMMLNEALSLCTNFSMWQNWQLANANTDPNLFNILSTTKKYKTSCAILRLNVRSMRRKSTGASAFFLDLETGNVNKVCLNSVVV